MITNMPNIVVKILIIICLLSLFAAMAMVTVTSPVIADESGLTIDGAIINRIVEPGEIFEHIMTVSLGTDSPALDVTVETRGLGQRTDGSYLELIPGEDRSDYSSREFISEINPASFYLEPGNSQTITARVEVPANIGNGSRYAVLYIKGVPRQETGIAFVPVIDVPVIITYGDLDIQGSIISSDTLAVKSGEPIAVTTTVMNAGNHHFKAANTVTIADNDGNVLATAAEQLTPCSIIPGYTYQFTRNMVINSDIEPGAYSITSIVNIEGGAEMTEITPLILTERYQPVTTSPEGTITRRSGNSDETREINWYFIAITIGVILAGGVLVVILARRRRN